MDEEIKITIYVHPSKEHMYEQGEKAGLDEKACKFFTHYDEVGLELTVIKQTGKVIYASMCNP